MSTQKQNEASRINGARSHGPVTPEGKQISCLNATRHGLLSGSVVLKGESVERLEGFYDALLAEHQPATQSEVALVNAMAAAYWRQLLVWGFEKLAKGIQHPQDPPRRRHLGEPLEPPSRNNESNITP